MLVESKLPSTLYKYCKLDDHFKNMVKNKELWFQTPNEFNDPYDCNVAWKVEYSESDIETFVRNSAIEGNSEDIIKSEIERIKADPNRIQLSIDSLKNEVQKLGISCFSQDGENPLMWAHYADKHKGVCIAFRAELLHNFFNLHIFPVEYTSTYPKVNFMKNHNKAINQILTTKSDNWKYEQEYRLVFEMRGAAPFPKEAIFEVCFGLNTSDNEILETIRFMRANGLGLPSVGFFKAQMDDVSYKVTYVQCNAS